MQQLPLGGKVHHLVGQTVTALRKPTTGSFSKLYMHCNVAFNVRLNAQLDHIFVPGDMDIVRDEITETAHGLITGQGPELLSGDDLPEGTPGVKGTVNLDLVANPLDGEIVTLDSKVYTFNTVVGTADGDVLIGADAAASVVNLVAAITLAGGDPTIYATAMTLHPTVTAVAGTPDEIDITAKSPGLAGNVVSTTNITSAVMGSATLEGGLDGEVFVIVVDGNTYKLATSNANALAGVAIDFTDAGVGNHTFGGLAGFPVTLLPAASIVDGSGAFPLFPGVLYEMQAPKAITAGAYAATDTLTYWWA